jgi:bla regulator protein blaR1
MRLSSAPRAAAACLAASVLGATFMIGAGYPRAHAQTPAPGPAQAQPQFEVASIKLNKSGDGRVMLGVQPGGRFTATNVPLRLLIRNAYQLQDFQIVGGPSWITSEHYDIVAKAEEGQGDAFQSPGNGQPSRGQLMIRALLADRFKLAVHNEDREMPIFALVLARPDGKLGPGLTKSEIDCAALGRGRGRGPGGPPPPPPDGRAAMTGPIQCGIRIGPGNMAVGGSPMSQVASSLGMFAGRIVFDRTGLTGNYDFQLTWTPDQVAQRPPGAPEPQINGVPIDPNGPSLFTAVQEQLGLKLDSQRGPVAVLVIDRVEHPTEN